MERKAMGGAIRALVLSAGLIAIATPLAAQTAVGGFYRQGNRPEVMFQYGPDRFCIVQNEFQMAAYGGFGGVQTVPFLRMRGGSTGGCGWPNGFYRRANEQAVFRLFGRSGIPNVGSDICHVVNEWQMAAFGGFSRVMVVSPGSDLGRGRGRVFPCRNP